VKLATVRLGGRTAAVRVDEDRAVEIEGMDDVGILLSSGDWRERASSADGPSHDPATLDFAPLVPRPDKIVCVGLNYRSHIAETGQSEPTFPTLFAKFSSALVGAHDDIVLPSAVRQPDWEAELAVVVGSSARGVDEQAAASVIAGFSVLNDVTARDWQHRTLQWLQGKSFESSTPLGPWLVTADEFDGTSGAIRCRVNGRLVQEADLSDLIFGPAALVSYISTIVTVRPGDVIATGTPAGIGAARTPPEFLVDGDVVTTSIEGVGECRNVCRFS
jgi:acylpyruvate hydrolase